MSFSACYPCGCLSSASYWTGFSPLFLADLKVYLYHYACLGVYLMLFCYSSSFSVPLSQSAPGSWGPCSCLCLLATQLSLAPDPRAKELRTFTSPVVISGFSSHHSPSPSHLHHLLLLPSSLHTLQIMQQELIQSCLFIFLLIIFPSSRLPPLFLGLALPAPGYIALLM